MTKTSRRPATIDEARELSASGQFMQRARNGVQFDPVTDTDPDQRGNRSRNGFLYSCYYHAKGIFFQTDIKSAVLKTITAVHDRLEKSTANVAKKNSTKKNKTPTDEPEESDQGSTGEAFLFSGDLKTIHQITEASIKEHIQHDPKRKQKFMLEISDILFYFAAHPEKIHETLGNPAVKTGITFAHAGLKGYDKEAYTYEDRRLISISNYLKKSTLQKFQDQAGQLHNIIDIIVFMMKEDIYYRPRWIQIIQDIDPAVRPLPTDQKNNPVLQILSGLAECCENMPLTPDELENIRRFH